MFALLQWREGNKGKSLNAEKPKDSFITIAREFLTFIVDFSVLLLYD